MRSPLKLKFWRSPLVPTDLSAIAFQIGVRCRMWGDRHSATAIIKCDRLTRGELLGFVLGYLKL